jgi:hypothetical protein
MIKKILFSLLWVVSVSFTGHAQVDSLENEVFLGINFGIDYNMNAYGSTPNTTENYEYYGIKPQYNFGIDGSFKLTRRIRPRVEFRYVNVKYGIDMTNANSPSTAGHTVVNVSYFGFNWHVDYLFIDTKKFQAFVSPGLKLEFKSQTNLSTGHWNTIELRHPKSIAGGALTMIFKYNITPRFGLTLSPEYTYFCRRFAAGNDKQYQRVSTNLGIEFRL